jgi:hypothetical protein
MPKLAKHRAKLEKLSTGKGVSPRGGARGGLARSPASWMVGNAGSGLRRRLAARAELREMRRRRVRGTGGALRRDLSACAGVVAEKSGDVRECALAGPRRVQGGSDREGPRRRERERGKGHSGQQLSNWRTGPTRQREEKRADEETGADRSAPLGSDREREGARERELPLTGEVRLSGGTGARPGWAELGWFGLLSPFLFLWIF